MAREQRFLAAQHAVLPIPPSRRELPNYDARRCTDSASRRVAIAYLSIYPALQTGSDQRRRPCWWCAQDENGRGGTATCTGRPGGQPIMARLGVWVELGGFRCFLVELTSRACYVSWLAQWHAGGGWADSTKTGQFVSLFRSYWCHPRGSALRCRFALCPPGRARQ